MGIHSVALLGFTLPNETMTEILARDPHMPTQTHAYAWSIVDAMRSAGLDVHLLSTAPVSNWPQGHPLVWHGRGFSVDEVEGVQLGFVNLVGVKHLTRFCSCLTAGIRALRRWRPSLLVVHGVHSPFLWFAVVARHLVGIPAVAILTDPPGVVLPNDGSLVRRLKSLDKAVVLGALRSFDGVVALTEGLARDFAPDAPVLVMDGIWRDEPRAEQPSEAPLADPDGFTVLYAGGLSEAYGVGILLRAMRLVRSGARLRLLGRGELLDSATALAQQDPRILPPSFLPRAEVLDAYAQADLLVQPRPVSQHFVPYSFPSKLLEYLASGTATLSTRLPGIPADLSQCLYWIDEDTDVGLATAIDRVRETPLSDRRARARAAARLVRSTRSVEAQGDRLLHFFEAVHNKWSATRSPVRSGR